MVKTTNPAEEAIETLSEVIRSLKRKKEQLQARLPKELDVKPTGKITHPLTGKVVYYAGKKSPPGRVIPLRPGDGLAKGVK